jgi:hypothetical protein
MMRSIQAFPALSRARECVANFLESEDKCKPKRRIL